MSLVLMSLASLTFLQALPNHVIVLVSWSKLVLLHDQKDGLETTSGLMSLVETFPFSGPDGGEKVNGKSKYASGNGNGEIG